MKILQINSVCVGSTGRIARQINQTAELAGHECYFAYGYGNRGSERDFVLCSRNQVRLHNLLSRLTDRQAFFSKRETQRLVAWIREVNPDLIHLHNLHGHYLHVGVLFEFLKAWGKPVVWTLHDCWPFTGHCSHFLLSKCERWKSGCFKCPSLSTYPPSFFADNSRKNWGRKRELFSSIENLTLVPVSDWLAELVTQSFLREKPMLRIHNGTDVETFSPRGGNTDIREKYGIGSRFCILGCASGWSASKGLGDFIKLRERIPEKDLAIVLVGVSEKQIAGLPDGIIGISRTENVNVLADLYSAADLLVNPTYEDNFPTVNIEALACGTPVCTYRTGGSPEAVDEATGFVVEQGNIDGIISAIGTVRSRGKSVYSEACRSRALAHFRKEDRFAEYVALYEKLLAVSD